MKCKEKNARKDIALMFKRLDEATLHAKENLLECIAAPTSEEPIGEAAILYEKLRATSAWVRPWKISFQQDTATAAMIAQRIQNAVENAASDMCQPKHWETPGCMEGLAHSYAFARTLQMVFHKLDYIQKNEGAE